MKNQGCLLMIGGRGLDIDRQSLLRNPKVFLVTVPNFDRNFGITLITMTGSKLKCRICN